MHYYEYQSSVYGFSEIVKFREMLEERIEKKEPPLSELPGEHKPVVAKLIHERCVVTPIA